MRKISAGILAAAAACIIGSAAAAEEISFNGFDNFRESFSVSVLGEESSVYAENGALVLHSASGTGAGKAQAVSRNINLEGEEIELRAELLCRGSDEKSSRCIFFEGENSFYTDRIIEIKNKRLYIFDNPTEYEVPENKRISFLIRLDLRDERNAFAEAEADGKTVFRGRVNQCKFIDMREVKIGIADKSTGAHRAQCETELYSLSAGGTAFSEKEYVIEDDIGDYTYFDSNWSVIRENKYYRVNLVPKTNSITAEKFDYKNPEKGNRIIFEKSTADDCYMDVLTNAVHPSFLTSKKYRNFVIGGEFKCSFNNGPNGYIMLRDSSGGSSVVNYNVLVFRNDESVLCSGGVTANGIYDTEDGWCSVKIYLNLDTHSFDIFINGKQIGKACSISSSIKNLDLVRFMYRAGEGSGSMELRSVYVKGMDKPFAGTEVRTSMFGSDKAADLYLSDKTAFHAYGRTAVSEGRRIKLGECVYDGGELYISPGDFYKASGANVSVSGNLAVCFGRRIRLMRRVKVSNGISLVPVRELYERLFGKRTFDDGLGLILISDTEQSFDLSGVIPYNRKPDTTAVIDKEWLSPIQYINDAVLYERPSAEDLLSGFAGGSHPRIIADKDDFEAIISQAAHDADLKKAVDAAVLKADSYVSEEAVSYVYDDDFRTLDTANRLESMMTYLGFAYRITGDKKYIDAAWRNFEAVCGFPDLNPAHPIDMGSYLSGMAIGYDWMYDGFTQEQRETICSGVKRLGLSVANDGFYAGVTARTVSAKTQNNISVALKWISNYNLWINRGIIMAALSFMEYDTELCSELLSNSIRSCEYGMKGFTPDGAWQESSNYWGVAADIFKSLYALKKIYGTDFGLSDTPGASEAGRFRIGISSLDNGVYNYHDAWPDKVYAPKQFPVIAAMYGQPELLAARKKQTASSGSFSVWDAVFYDAEAGIAGVPEGLRRWQGNEICTFRDSENKMFFASQGGPVKVYHYHEDAGDFIFELDGIRWACALGGENYNLPLANTEKYRWRAEGHNTVVINNGPGISQIPEAFAPVVKSGEAGGDAYVVYDMTEVYADADSFQRGFTLEPKEGCLTVTDEISLSKTSEIYWFMHTEADAEIISSRVVKLTRGGKTAYLSFAAEGAEECTLSIMDAAALPSSPSGAGQNANYGIRKAAIRLSADSDVKLSVCISRELREAEITPIKR
ncbi:MAG: DUF4962 domain-containing protein [Clostridia bacterium]|nr:DUF4962 domain-containing protein [Clostridia bacterium]